MWAAAPPSSGVALTFTLLSFRGSVRLAVVADADLPASPEALVAAFEEEIAAGEPPT